MYKHFTVRNNNNQNKIQLFVIHQKKCKVANKLL